MRTKQKIITALLLLGSQGIAIGQARQPTPGIIGLRADMKLDQKIGIIQKFIETDYYGGRKIPVCMPYDGGISGTVRAWKDADFSNQSLPSFRTNIKGQPPTVSGADWLNNENSTYLDGGYLLSQVYRYQYTHKKAALAECGRALESIRTIAELAPPERFGWLCKPYGGRLQDFSSPDQNIYVVEGLWAFLPYADVTQAAWIREVIPAIAVYWEKNNYTILAFSDVWDMRKDATFMRMFKVINLVAYQISKEKKFLEVADRLEATHGELSTRSVSLFDTRAASKPGYFDDWRKVCEFSVNLFAPIQLDILASLRPGKKKEYLPIWERLLKHSLIGYDRTYGSHYYYTEVRLIGNEYVWRPLQTAWPSLSHDEIVHSEKFALWRYSHRIYWSDATSRVPLIYLMYLKNGGRPIPYIEEVVRDIMEKLDFDHLHWMADPHHDQTIPEIEFMLHTMTSEIPNYIGAYYLGRQLGFWKKTK